MQPRDDGRFNLKTSSVQNSMQVPWSSPQAWALLHQDASGPWVRTSTKERTSTTRLLNPKGLVDKEIIILGGGDSALDWTLELHGKVKKITLIHRRSEYRAQPASVNKMKSLVDGTTLEEFQGQVRSVTVTTRALSLALKLSTWTRNKRKSPQTRSSFSGA